jgi:hypothetical protein
MNDRLVTERDYSSLSVKDLLEAREAYHVHLAHLDNVIGTAIGRRRVRVLEAHSPELRADARRVRSPKTLMNTAVARWSPPCVLVFVDRWVPCDGFVKYPDQAVPRLLYMPDGRVVPTCVVYVEKGTQRTRPLTNLTFPKQLLGGGFPILTEVQGEQRVGSFGCLVTSGAQVFGLTNRHVAGPPGQRVVTLVDGERYEIGVSAPRQLGTLPFAQAYPGWPGARAVSNLDAGLVRLDSVTDWTAQIYGVGAMGRLADLSTDNFTLDLIGCPVRAFGGASGAMTGEIQGLFYRYRSVGGQDFVADLLIGPRSGADTVPTRPGDSGTVWFVDELARNGAPSTGRGASLRPIALQWGGQRFVEHSAEHFAERLTDGVADATYQFALATCLSTVCRELEVEILRDWNIGHSDYWGKTGHYKIGAKACELLSDKKLSKLMMANQGNIGYGDDELVTGRTVKMDEQGFVPLADVPDLVWRTTRKMDAANHFADLDEEGQGRYAGKTLLELWRDGRCNTPAQWSEFYDTLGRTLADGQRGALPFRVWQSYAAMVAFVRAGNVPRYVAAAGTLSHYVGDACQPLHVSYLHHGRPGRPDESKVHSVYETVMLDRHAAELIEEVNRALRGKKVADAELFTGGRAAADATVALMEATIATLPPLEVIEAFNAVPSRGRVEHMWEALHARTVACVARGALVLATIWESAWREGGGAKVADGKIKTIPAEPTLKALYLDKTFVPAVWLKNLSDEELPGLGDGGGSRPRARLPARGRASSPRVPAPGAR